MMTEEKKEEDHTVHPTRSGSSSYSLTLNKLNIQLPETKVG